LRNSPDDDLVSLSQRYEIRSWCIHFNCTEAALREAIRLLGTHAVRYLERYFELRRSDPDQPVELVAALVGLSMRRRR
jgi:hypothetical protein